MMQVLNQYISRDFVYGDSDCCQFAGACIEEQTGENPAKRFKYHTEAEAEALLAEYGGLSGLLTHVLGTPTEEPQEGFIALVDKPALLGVVYRGRIVARTPTDINDIALERASRFWNPCPA